MADTISSQIYISRDQIRSQITEHVKKYLELENVDLTKSSFLSFIIDIVSTLTGNLIFYNSSVYREFFLTKAQLSESILNLAAFLGYTPEEAIAARANVLITMPLTFTDPSITITFPENYIFYANSTEFRTYYTTVLEITNNTDIEITIYEENRKYTLPYTQDSENLYFVLPTRQYKNVEQEYQIDEDLERFQFVTLDVTIDGKIANVEVQVRNPGDAAYTTWQQFDSLYLMSNTDTGYVYRRTEEGIQLYFGNGLIGVQPEPGASILVTTQVTEGADGNVITGSITRGDRIYTSEGGVNRIVNFSITNTTPAIGGEDEESIEETRRNAIAALTTLKRLVTEDDYKNINVVIPDAPLTKNSLPVLKRSDIGVNDIQIFTTLYYGTDPDDNITLPVPTRNATYETSVATTQVPRGTIITIDGTDYYMIFDMVIDLINSSATYYYIMQEIQKQVTLLTSFASTFNIFSDKLTIQKIGNIARFELNYHSDEPNAALATCTMESEETGVTYTMTNDGTSTFSYDIIPYTIVPTDDQIFYFTIYDPSLNPVARYSAEFIFRQNLEDFMRSNVASDGTTMTIYDIPVVKKSYYDSIDVATFELSVLQELMLSMNFVDYRMLTDFANLKFTNSTGILNNLQYNKLTRSAVIDIVDSLPSNPAFGDKYILSEDSPNHVDDIATCIDATNVIWIYTTPVADDITFIENFQEKYIYSERGWIPIPNYTIPLEIYIEVFRETTYSGTINDLTITVKEAIMDAFKDRFGANIEIYRSEIIDVVQTLDGVDHCRLKKPETSIFYNFELQDLTQEELLSYGPEYIYFTRDDITVRVI